MIIASYRHHLRSMLQKGTLVSILLALGAASALANDFESGGVGLDAAVRFKDSVRIVPFLGDDWALPVIITFVLLILAIGILSHLKGSEGSGLVALSRGPASGNLFLGMRYRPLPSQNDKGTSPNDEKIPQDDLGYLRALALKEASFVAGHAFKKGASVRLFLGSLPNFPDRGLAVDAVVSHAKPLGGEPCSYLVDVRFYELPDHVKSSLASYLHSLRHHSSALSHA